MDIRFRNKFMDKKVDKYFICKEFFNQSGYPKRPLK